MFRIRCRKLGAWVVPAAMLLVIVLMCGIIAYFLVQKGRNEDDETEDNGGDTPGNDNGSADNKTYIQTPYDHNGIEILVGLSVSDDNSEELNEHYRALGTWVGRRYAILDFTLANDFSDVATAPRKISATISKVRKPGHHQPEVIVLGIRIQPKDADATKENGEKLGAIAKNAIIIFQTHEPPDEEHCKIGISEIMISKANYQRLSKGINSSVAISTTLAIVKFKPTDPGKEDTGAACDSREVLSRTSVNCASMGSLTDTGHQVKGGYVYEYATNASIQKLFVTNDDKPTSTSWKYNIAFFDVDLYLPAHNRSCPDLNLADFYRKGPSASKTGR